ncbi:hypothetical protein Leryth_015005 [Lithospermum erythrorhizon]|nr:hypothetical protein Leryth_015005 [Lithospermum erythrorhizon]
MFKIYTKHALTPNLTHNRYQTYRIILNKQMTILSEIDLRYYFMSELKSNSNSLKINLNSSFQFVGGLYQLVMI